MDRRFTNRATTAVRRATALRVKRGHRPPERLPRCYKPLIGGIPGPLGTAASERRVRPLSEPRGEHTNGVAGGMNRALGTLVREESAKAVSGPTLVSCGCRPVGPVATVHQALRLASDESLDGAVLDVNLRDQMVFPVAEELARRGVRVVFATRLRRRLRLSRAPRRMSAPAQALFRARAQAAAGGDIRRILGPAWIRNSGSAAQPSSATARFLDRLRPVAQPRRPPPARREHALMTPATRSPSGWSSILKGSGSRSSREAHPLHRAESCEPLSPSLLLETLRRLGLHQVLLRNQERA